MGTGKKEAARRERQGKARDGMSNVRVKVREKLPYVSVCSINHSIGRELLPRCKEGQGLESPQGWKAAEKRRGKDYKSSVLSIERYSSRKD